MKWKPGHSEVLGVWGVRWKSAERDTLGEKRIAQTGVRDPTETHRDTNMGIPWNPKEVVGMQELGIEAEVSDLDD